MSATHDGTGSSQVVRGGDACRQARTCVECVHACISSQQAEKASKRTNSFWMVGSCLPSEMYTVQPARIQRAHKLCLRCMRTQLHASWFGLPYGPVLYNQRCLMPDTVRASARACACPSNAKRARDISQTDAQQCTVTDSQASQPAILTLAHPACVRAALPEKIAALNALVLAQKSRCQHH